MTPKSIALVDDHVLFRNGLKSLLLEFQEINIVIEASDGNELLAQLKTKPVQVILLDIKMEPGMNGMDALEQIRQKHPEIKVIMLSQFDDDQTIYHLVEKGAHGFLDKKEDIETIVDAVYAVMGKGYYYTEKVQNAISKGTATKHKVKHLQNICTLSEREIEVVRCICKQMSIKKIAEKMHLSPRTIDTYIENIYLKTGAKKVAGIVLYAIEHRLLD